MLREEMRIILKLMISCIDYVLLSNVLTFIHAGHSINSINSCETEFYFQKVQ